jgi:hypothetical protein
MALIPNNYWAGHIKRARRFFIAIAGGIVLMTGIALIVLPGPAFIVIPAGLAILAIEFAWAKRWLDKCKSFFKTKKGESDQSKDCSEPRQKVLPP